MKKREPILSPQVETSGVPLIYRMIVVLCVDDDPDILEITKWFIERSGTISVETATPAGEILGMLERRSSDAIVSDYQMPVMDGIEFPRVLRARGTDTPFIIFTKKGREEVVIQAYDSGVDFSIQKGGDIATQFCKLGHKIVKAVRIRAADAAFRESEERYRSVVENTTEGIAVIQDELIQYANPALVSMLQGMPCEVAETRFDRFVQPDDRASVVSFSREVQEGKVFPRSRDFRNIGNGGARDVGAGISGSHPLEPPARVPRTPRRHHGEEGARERMQGREPRARAGHEGEGAAHAPRLHGESGPVIRSLPHQSRHLTSSRTPPALFDGEFFR